MSMAHANEWQGGDSGMAGRTMRAGETGENAMKWSERPKSNRYAIIGAFIGMAIAAAVAVEFAFYDTTFVRYLIMVTGLLGGGGVGFLLGARRQA